MYRLLALFVLMTILSKTNQQGKSIGALIEELFQNQTVDTKNPNVGGGGGGNPIEGINKCECVPYYLCNNNSVINSNGEGIIDIRADEGPCASYLDFCCLPPNITKTPITPMTIIDTNRTGCGWRNPDGVGFRIVGDMDNEAKFGEFPWMVAILREEAIDGSDEILNIYQCGGSLIHPQVVITAAHCVNTKERQFKVRAGEWDTQTRKEIFPHQDRDVKSIIVHPQFYGGALFNDIAFVILESPFDLTDNVGVVCLPPQDQVIPSGTRCFASGWGKDTFGQEGKYQVILKKIDLPIVDRQTCQSNLRSTRLGRFFNLDESFVCAGGEQGKDTCKGDGGSPLVCPIPGQKDRYQQAGIVAWGIGCGENQIPGVYANVAMFRDWINEQAAYNNLGTLSYEY